MRLDQTNERENYVSFQHKYHKLCRCHNSMFDKPNLALLLQNYRNKITKTKKKEAITSV